MGLVTMETTGRLAKLIERNISTELGMKARKHDGFWNPVEHYTSKKYPGLNQVVAIRKIAPRGMEEKWSNGDIRRYKPMRIKRAGKWTYTWFCTGMTTGDPHPDYIPDTWWNRLKCKLGFY